MAHQNDVDMTIQAWPTKELFIEYLVRDVKLGDAIVDLVDNSVDGAMRLNPNGNLEGLEVRIEATSERFRIADNCGGITVEVARKYAFRFGRDEDLIQQPHSIGKFGVGMKRAFFKLGKRFRVESTTDSTHFVVDEDVGEWKKKKAWTFDFESFKEDGEFPQEEIGTTIEVAPLHDEIGHQFELENFIISLRDKIEKRHLTFIDQGLAISLNQIPASLHLLQLKSSDKLKTGYKEFVVREKEQAPVTVKIYAGIGEPDPNLAGWYIFCNGRLILEADQSKTTGWEGRPKPIPKFHGQFNYFRGFVFFDSDDAGLLPWNTAKTDVVADAPIYAAARLEMIRLMRPVIDFLNNLKDEKDGREREGADPGPLESAVDSTFMKAIDEVETSYRFVRPEPKREKPGPKMGRIVYNKPRDLIEKVKKQLRVKTQKEVGEQTFDYYYDLEAKD
jgi:hypothetical protein